MADAPDRAALGVAQKLLFAPAKQRRQLLTAQPLALVEIGQGRTLGKLVPGADQLAVVAAVDAVGHQRAQLQRNRPRVFDRQIRNAAPRVQPPRRDDGLRGADADAGTAAAAVLGHRLGRRQRQVHIDFAQKKHRARIAAQHQCVFAAPALAAARGQLGLEHRRRIGERAKAHRPDVCGDAFAQFLQPRAQHLVVVAPPGINRHDAFAGTPEPREFIGLPIGGGAARQIIHARRDDADRARHQLGGAGALHAVRGHIGHVTMEPLGQPGTQPLFGGR
jgi:hypothetical protein